MSQQFGLRDVAVAKKNYNNMIALGGQLREVFNKIETEYLVSVPQKWSGPRAHEFFNSVFVPSISNMTSQLWAETKNALFTVKSGIISEATNMGEYGVSLGDLSGILVPLRNHIKSDANDLRADEDLPQYQIDHLLPIKDRAFSIFNEMQSNVRGMGFYNESTQEMLSSRFQVLKDALVSEFDRVYAQANQAIKETLAEVAAGNAQTRNIFADLGNSGFKPGV